MYADVCLMRSFQILRGCQFYFYLARVHLTSSDLLLVISMVGLVGCSEMELIIKPHNLVSLEGILDPNEWEGEQYQEHFGGKSLCYR